MVIGYVICHTKIIVYMAKKVLFKYHIVEIIIFDHMEKVDMKMFLYLQFFQVEEDV